MSCDNSRIPLINSTGWYILSNNEESSIYNTVTKYIDIADLSFVNYYSIIYYTNKDGSGGWPSSVTLNPAVDYCNITEILGDNTQIKPNLAYWIYVEDFQYFGQPETPGIALTYDISSAFSIYVNSYEDNIDANGIQGPSYICFDPIQMSDPSSVITYTATANIHVSGFLIGYGGPGGAYIYTGPGNTRGGGGGGGNGGVDISFNMNQGDTFTCQFKGGTPGAPGGYPTGWFSGAKTILTTSDTSYNLEQGGEGGTGDGNDSAPGGAGKNGGGNGGSSLSGGVNSGGLRVNGIIKTATKNNSTPIFSPNGIVGANMKFGSGGGGGLDGYYGGPSYYQNGGSHKNLTSLVQVYDLSPGRQYYRNYGAGAAGGQSGPSSPKYGGNPGYAGLILTTFKRTNQSFLLNYDISSAFSTFINTDYEFNAGGPSYAIFDPSQMSDASSVITFTAQQDIRISGFLIGYGGCGGSGGRTYAATNYIKISGGGGGGNGGTAISFDMNQGETFTLQFRNGGTPIANNLNGGLNFENATTILTTSDTSYNLSQGGTGSNIDLNNGTYRPDGGLGTNGGGNGGDGSVYGVSSPSPGTDSSGVIVSSIIKAAQRVNGTVLFSNSYSNPTTIPYVPPRFGAGGAGANLIGGAWANAGVFDIGGGFGTSPNNENEKNANLYLRNYGAGGAGGTSTNGPAGYAAFGGTGGIPGLIISTSPI